MTKLVICINNEHKQLTLKKVYKVIEETKDHYRIANDYNYPTDYYKYRFKLLDTKAAKILYNNT